MRQEAERDISPEAVESKMATTYVNPALSWYVLRTRPQHERTVYSNLLAKGFSAWLPLHRQPSRRKDRDRWISVPLFSGYVFVHMAISDKMQVVNTHGVHNFVANSQGHPIPVSGSMLDTVNRIETYTHDYALTSIPEHGPWGRVVRGPLSGLEGIVEGLDVASRLVVPLEPFELAISVTISRADVTFH